MSQKLSVYYLINKPFGVLSQFSDEGNNPGLGSLYSLPKDVYPVGRLDMDSEGLLILTNDRSLNNLLLNPKHEHLRTYYVEVDKIPDETAISQLINGVEINLKGKIHKSKKCLVDYLEGFEISEREPPVNRIKHPLTSWISFSLSEGKNRQVRRMTAKVGHPTLRLLRMAIENLELGDLPNGGIVQISKRVIYEKLKLGHSM
jgi:23S rRNA pseudouridine2457 synthase